MADEIRSYAPEKGDYGLDAPGWESMPRDPLGFLSVLLAQMQRGAPEREPAVLPIGPGGFQVMRTRGTAEQVRSLDNIIQLLANKIPNYIRKVGETRPWQFSVGSKSMPNIADTTHWGPGTTASVKINPNQLLPGRSVEGAQTVFHETMHPVMEEKLAEARPETVERLGRGAADRMGEIAPTMASDDLRSLWNNLIRGDYRGRGYRDLWEELAIRMMEHNVAKRRLLP